MLRAQDAWIAIAIVVLLTAVYSCTAYAHDGHTVTNAQYHLQHPAYKYPGEMRPGMNPAETYLWGINRDRESSSFMQTVNCCKYGGNGDCQLMPVLNVKIVAGGYEVEGEYIPEAETTASPDDQYYRCQHAGKPSHCFFVPGKSF